MTLLQASAGTGKTFTIAALATRYVAEGILPIERLLVITFTRMATGELRERVRDRLVRAYDGLVDVLDGAGGHEDDEVVQLLAQAPGDEVEARRDRLGKAIADFDAATIETTHGFCLQVLYGLGTAGDVDREVTFVEDVRDLMEEVVDDLYLRRFAAGPNPLELHPRRGDGDRQARARPPRRRDRAAAVRRPGHAIHPPPFRRRGPRRRWTTQARPEDPDLRRRAASVCATPWPTPSADRAACARLRERYDVVLVDEFQDTDPVQWDIMQRGLRPAGSRPSC